MFGPAGKRPPSSRSTQSSPHPRCSVDGIGADSIPIQWGQYEEEYKKQLFAKTGVPFQISDVLVWF